MDVIISQATFDEDIDALISLKNNGHNLFWYAERGIEIGIEKNNIPLVMFYRPLEQRNPERFLLKSFVDDKMEIYLFLNSLGLSLSWNVHIRDKVLKMKDREFLDKFIGSNILGIIPNEIIKHASVHCSKKILEGIHKKYPKEFKNYCNIYGAANMGHEEEVIYMHSVGIVCADKDSFIRCHGSTLNAVKIFRRIFGQYSDISRYCLYGSDPEIIKYLLSDGTFVRNLPVEYVGHIPLDKIDMVENEEMKMILDRKKRRTCPLYLNNYTDIILRF